MAAYSQIDQLALLVEMLLEHTHDDGLGPPLRIIESEHGTYGVALVLDGWYARRDAAPGEIADIGCSAESALAYWQESLAEVHAEVQRRPTRYL